MKIAFVYLDVTNLGDLIIRDTASYVLNEVLKEIPGSSHEVIPVDIGSYKCTLLPEYANKPSFFERAIGGVFRRYSKFFPCKKFSGKVLLKYWHRSGTYRYFKEHELNKFEGADCILFSGGGLIKYHAQDFYLYISDITKYACEHNIPVIFNGQGVEKYNIKDPKCVLLKEALNRDCVKHISTRDDYETLTKCYMVNKNITVTSVCDSAFWCAETYGLKRREASDNFSSKKIGLNVIRPNIFREYLTDVSLDTLCKMYIDLIEMLCSFGHSVELYSNGTAEDTNFGKMLFEKYPQLTEKYHVTFAIPKTPEELAQTLMKYDRFMAARLHGAIVGTVLGIPNVSIVWNYKQILFGKQMGLEENFIRNDFEAGHIYDALMNAAACKIDPSYKNSVKTDLKAALSACMPQK